MDWRPVPILPMADPDESRRFYRTLGFHVVDAAPEPPPYLILVREGAELHLEHVERRGADTSPQRCYVAVDDADLRYAEWSPLDLGAGHVGPPQDMPWGLRELVVTDPFGNTIRVATSR